MTETEALGFLIQCIAYGALIGFLLLLLGLVFKRK
jgi:hypothetical protein